MRIDERDNIEVDLDTGHKVALRDIKKGKRYQIRLPDRSRHRGHQKGNAVHSHNLNQSQGCSRIQLYSKNFKIEPVDCNRTFQGFVRGTAGSAYVTTSGL